MPYDPDPRTAADDEQEDAGRGASSTDPAEGSDDLPVETPGSPEG